MVSKVNQVRWELDVVKEQRPLYSYKKIINKGSK